MNTFCIDDGVGVSSFSVVINVEYGTYREVLDLV